MERFRRDSSAGFKDHMRKLVLQPTGHGLQLVWMEVIEHNDVCACSGRLSSLFVVAGLDLQQQTQNVSINGQTESEKQTSL